MIKIIFGWKINIGTGKMSKVGFEIFSQVNSFIANLPWSESFDFQIFKLLSSKLC